MPHSFSRLQLYRTCPKQYEYACVKNIKRPITPGEAFGSSVHNTLKKWGELELLHQAEPDQQQTLFSAPDKEHPPLFQQQLLDYWHQSFIVDGYDNRMAADFDRQRGSKVMQHFYNWWSAEPRQVVLVEKGFTATMGTTDVSGRFDRIEQLPHGTHIIDFKTGRLRDQDSVDADLQLSIYAQASRDLLQQDCVQLTLLFLHDDGITERKTTRNSSQLQDAGKQISMLSSEIAAGNFHPEPAVEKCKKCPYRSICPDSAVANT